MIKSLKIIFPVIAIAILLTSIEYGKKTQYLQVKDEEVIAEAIPEIPLSPVEYADKYAAQYKVDASLLKKVMWCESSNNPKAIGDGGLAKNVMQFHKPTFDSYSNKLGEELSYDSYKDQIKLAAYMFSIGEAHHWTCYKKVIGH